VLTSSSYTVEQIYAMLTSGGDGEIACMSKTKSKPEGFRVRILMLPNHLREQHKSDFEQILQRPVRVASL